MHTLRFNKHTDKLSGPTSFHAGYKDFNLEVSYTYVSLSVHSKATTPTNDAIDM